MFSPAGNTQGHRKRTRVFSVASLTRAKSKIREYVLNANFNCFCTFTFSPRDFDRTDFNACKAYLTDYLTHKLHLKNWLVIPEKHDDGSIHFHGFCSMKREELKYGYAKRDSKNIVHAHYYSECINKDIGRNDFQFLDIKRKSSVQSACAYILKYITKATFSDFSLLYFNSRGLKSDEVVLELTGNRVDSFLRFCHHYNIREYSNSHVSIFDITPSQLKEFLDFEWIWEVCSDNALPVKRLFRSFEPQQIEF